MNQVTRTTPVPPTAFVLLLLLCLPGTLAARSMPWSATVIDAMNNPNAIVTGDFDGDGDTDFAVVSLADNAVFLYSNDGAGQFSSANLGVCQGAESIAAGDLDSDGDLDLAAGCGFYGRVIWLENTGAASAWPRVVVDTPDDPEALLFADMDADGDLDLAAGVGNPRSNVGYYENTDGLGGGMTWMPIAPTSGRGRDLVVGDMDGDGALELAATRVGSPDLELFEQGPTGWTPSWLVGSSGSYYIELVDWNLDGFTDVVGTVLNGISRWFENTGAFWTPTNVYQAGWDPRRGVIEDLDRDGDPDYLVADLGIDDIVYFENTDRTVAGVTPTTLGLTLGAPNAIGVLDADGDGDNDLIVSNYDDFLSLLTNEQLHGRVTDWAPEPLLLSAGTASDLATLDFDRDSAPEILVAGATGLSLAWNDGDGTFTDQVVAVGAFDSPQGSDLDQDGDMDIIAVDGQNGDLVWFEAGPSQTWTPNVLGPAGSPGSVAVGDLDRDGAKDIVTFDQLAGTVTLYTNDGSSVFSTQLLGTTTAPTAPELVDLDSDGDVDVVFGTGAGVEWLQNPGPAGTWLLGAIGAPGAVIEVKTIDENRDGSIDVVALTSTGDLWAYSNDGASTSFAPLLLGSVAGSGQAFVSTDVDYDGLWDHGVLSNAGLTWLYGDGTTELVTLGLSGLTSFGVEDLDRDGDYDLALGGSGGYMVGRGAWAQVGVSVIAPAASIPVLGGETLALFEVDASHLGLPTEPGATIASLNFSFTDAGGLPLLQSDIEAMLASIQVFEDDGNGIFDPLLDTLVGTATAFPPLGSVGLAGVATPTATTLTPNGDTTLFAQGTLQPNVATAAVSQVLVTLDASIPGMALSSGFELVTGSASASVLITAPQAPTALAVVSSPSVEGTPVTLDGSGSSDADGTVVLEEWDCDGDGTYETVGTTVTCTFADDGTFTVGLQVTDDDGLQATTTVAVLVTNVPPTVSVSGPATLPEGQSFSPVAVTVDVPADPVTLAWALTDATGALLESASGPSPTLTAPDNGPLAVTVTVSDDDGGTTSAAYTLIASNLPPSVAISGPSTAAEGQTITWSASATDVAADTVGFGWTLQSSGGQTISTGSGTTFSASVPDDGTWTVQVLGTDDDGGVGSASSTVNVSNLPPVFVSSPPSVASTGALWSYAPVVSDPGADPLTFGLGPGAPSGLQIDSPTGQLVWFPTSADVGTATFSLIGTDNGGAAATQGITVSVSLDDQDGDGLPDDWEVSNGLDTSVDDAGLDPDGDGLTNMEEFLNSQDPLQSGVPGLPTPVSPTLGAVVDSGELTWDRADDPDGDPLTYEVELYDGPSLASLLDSESALTAGSGDVGTWTPSVALTENAEMSWRVRAQDPWGAGAWTDLAPFLFSQTPDAPDVPVPLEPMGGASAGSSSPLLVWAPSSDPEGDAVSYEVEVAPTAGGAVLTAAAGLTETEWTVDVALGEDSEVDWQVRAVDAGGNASAWSSPASFRVDVVNQPPPAPLWISPDDETAIEGNSVTLAVSPVIDPEGEPVSYWFQVDRSGAFQSASLQEELVSGTEWTTPGDLEGNVWWWGRVRAEDGQGGVSAWTSRRWWIRGEEEAPTAPRALAPLGGGDLRRLISRVHRRGLFGPRGRRPHLRIRDQLLRLPRPTGRSRRRAHPRRRARGHRQSGILATRRAATRHVFVDGLRHRRDRARVSCIDAPGVRGERPNRDSRAHAL